MSKKKSLIPDMFIGPGRLSDGTFVDIAKPIEDRKEEDSHESIEEKHGIEWLEDEDEPDEETEQ